MSNKRPASEMVDYIIDEGPQAKKFKATEPQIIASNEEIDERVAKLIDSKKQSQGSSQVQGHLQADAAAIAAAKSAHISRAPAHSSTPTSSADQGPIVTYSENLPPGLPDVIEDRLSILEKKLYSNLAARAVPRDVYGRIKALEERVLKLEKQGIIGTRHAESSHTSSSVEQAEAAPRLVPLPEAVDDRIKELQEKLSGQSTHH